MRDSDRISVSAPIDAPAARVYAIIADYRNGHPKIIPPRCFGPIEVERGGVGAGTVIRFTMKILGTTTELRGEVTEPEPGRVLVESYPQSGTVTRFIVDSAAAAKSGASGGACVVTIETELARRAGFRSWLENYFGGRFLKKVYAEELGMLRRVARESTASAGIEDGRRA